MIRRRREGSKHQAKQDKPPLEHFVFLSRPEMEKISIITVSYLGIKCSTALFSNREARVSQFRRRVFGCSLWRGRDVWCGVDEKKFIDKSE
jgi:hypothetical protein